MIKEQWDVVWNTLDDCAKEFNKFLETGLSSIHKQKIQKFVSKFETLKQDAIKMDGLISSSIEPINVDMPWPDKDFAELWQYWKDYRLESFNKYYKSREEKKALEYLYEISEQKKDMAMMFLNFAMSGGYPRFFIVTKKDNEKPKTISYESDFQ